jgi:hypothetical protein
MSTQGINAEITLTGYKTEPTNSALLCQADQTPTLETRQADRERPSCPARKTAHLQETPSTIKKPGLPCGTGARRVPLIHPAHHCSPLFPIVPHCSQSSRQNTACQRSYSHPHRLTKHQPSLKRNRTPFALFGMQNRALRPYLTTDNTVLISVMSIAYRRLLQTSETAVSETA